MLITVENEIHLILLDVQMPGMDGFETAKHLQMTDKTKDIPIIFITAVFKADEFIRRGYTLGAVDYMTKPIDDNLLFNRVNLYHKLFMREEALKDALRELKKKESLLIYQSRMAAMGEMIGAIAHQWRQPLNAMGVIIQEIRDAYEYNELTKESMDKTIEDSMGQLQFMSKTIDDFRNYFKPSKDKQLFKINERD